MAMRRRIDDAIGKTALARWRAEGEECDRATVATAVRWSLEELAARLPGRAVEVRVPPAGAVQILGGTVHRRGTPPAVIEMAPSTWLDLVVGNRRWEDAVNHGEISASGERADLGAYLPLADFADG